MRKIQPDPARPDGRADFDTSSSGNPQGAPDPGMAPTGCRDRPPHERDESARATGEGLKEKPTPSGRQISQAGEDVEEGFVDTDRRGVPNDVPKSS